MEEKLWDKCLGEAKVWENTRIGKRRNRQNHKRTGSCKTQDCAIRTSLFY